ncbi:MAG: phosphoglucosamine mutase [Candidatus Aureabacteria bacterium]|nr:phosphoglucosamine mutase [Candidatus Auribacterota bacterium]NLW94987.1 phosphoglucosamine mutase [Chlamydiota bacterium]HOE26978.1 phosphoglucosamine mutase [bacterium]HQM52250.1 phosphoglucosamine mutase [bacterium]
MGRLFGTDGVRGVANVHPMTAEMALEIGRAAAYVCKRHKTRRHSIVIGKDTRLSGYMLESALTAGICSMGVDVLLVGPMSTPGIAFITRSMRADAGVVISASHNPYQDNGIKLFSRDGFKLPDAVEDEIEKLITGGRIKNIRPTADEIGKAHRIDDAMGRYIVFCKSSFPETLSLEGMRIVLDCANGATYKAAPTIFSELGAEVTVMHCAPDGLNINDRCGSLYTEGLSARVRDLEADIGLAFDGDGDRLIAVDETGREITGDHMMAICAKWYKEQGLLENNLVIATVMSNFGFFVALREMGIEPGVSKVGDRYVLEMMREKGAVLGGEASGHLIFLNHHTTGDGIISALQLLSALRHYRQPLSVLARVMTLSPQRMINVDVKTKPPLDSIPELRKAIKEAESELGDRGRVLIRYSGTQAMCRVMVEGPSQETTDRLTRALADVVARSIG